MGEKGNGKWLRAVYLIVRRVLYWVVPLVLAPWLYCAYSDYLSAQRKFDLIESDQSKPGTRVTLTPLELNSWVEQEVTAAVPDGVRNPRLELGSGSATGSALIDFAKVRRAQGKPPGWLMSKLLEGERPVRVAARIRSAGGQATVDVQSVEISGVTIDGRMLDFLIQNYLLPMYPQAKIGEPFQLGHRIERIEIQPSAVGVLIGR